MIMANQILFKILFKKSQKDTYVYLERKSFIFCFIQNISSLKGMQFNLFKKQLIGRVF